MTCEQRSRLCLFLWGLLGGYALHPDRFEHMFWYGIPGSIAWLGVAYFEIRYGINGWKERDRK